MSSPDALPIDPEIAAYLEGRAGGTQRSEPTPEEARSRLRQRYESSVSGGLPEMASVRQRRLEEPGRELAARHYLPRGEADLFTVFFHSGGWVAGDLDTADGSCRRLAAAARTEVLSIDYRLAPECPFPAAVEDAVTAVDRASALAEGRPLIVAGESAGATLATVAASGRHALTIAPAAQLLCYGSFDSDLERDSYRDCPEIWPLRRQEMAWYWDRYLPDRERRGDPDAAPLRADDLSAAAPAVVAVAGNDPLRDEGLAYAARLEAEGVTTRLLYYGDATHGFLGFPGEFALRDRAVLEMAGALREVTLGPPSVRDLEDDLPAGSPGLSG